MSNALKVYIVLMNDENNQKLDYYNHIMNVNETKIRNRYSMKFQ